MSKALDGVSLIPEITDILETIEKIKSPEYGMILRTIFNLHNVTQALLDMLQMTGKIKDDGLRRLYDIRETAVAQTIITMLTLYFQLKGIEDCQETRAKIADELEADLQTLVSKQQEYGK